MKKYYLFLLFFLSIIVVSNAQRKFQVSGGIASPFGDITELSAVGFTVNLNYLFEVTETISLGPAVSYLHFFGVSKFSMIFDPRIEDIRYLPIAVAGRYTLTDKITLGLDLGYALGSFDNQEDGLVLGIRKDYNGSPGIYFAPVVQYGLNEKLALVLAARNISPSDGMNSNLIALEILWSF